MAYLLDTNILLRLAEPRHPMHQDARKSIRHLLHRKEQVRIIPQVLYEFWVVATRPTTSNGLGLTIPATLRLINGAQAFFELAPDSQPIYREWETLVQQYSVSGVNAHDARIVAAMKVHRFTHLLTFNIDDFKRYHGKEINVVAPLEVLAPEASGPS